MLKLVKVCKTFEDSCKAIDDFSYEFNETGLYTILGSSGSGKTTLLNIIGGLEKVTSGSILYNNSEIKDINKYRYDNISYIFQESFLLSNKTVYDNLDLYLNEIGITSKEEKDNRISNVLKIVKMNKYKKHYVDNLSGGEKQRIAIARALLRNNKIILADEITSNLDLDNSKLIMNILKNISKKSLVILVSHNRKLIEEYTDKVLVMNDGKLESSFDMNNNIYDKINELNYDDSYENNKISFRNDLSTYSSKRDKIFFINNSLLIFMSIILFIVSYLLITVNTIDNDMIRYTPYAYMLDKNVYDDGRGNFLSNSKIKNTYLADGKISNIVEEKIYDFYLFQNNLIESKGEKALYLPLEYNKYNIVYGNDNIINDNDVIISKALAESIRGDIKITDIINDSICYNKINKFNIVGIVDSNQYEVFYKKVNNIVYGIQNITLLYTDYCCNVVEDINSLNIELYDGSYPKSNNEILALNNGKNVIGSKAGEFIISGLYNILDSSSDEYKYILTENNIIYEKELNLLSTRSNSKNNYLFLMNTDDQFDNVITHEEYAIRTLKNEINLEMTSFYVPMISGVILIISYIIIFAYIIVNNKLKVLVFKLVVGKGKNKVAFKFVLTNAIQSLLFIVIPYAICGVLINDFIRICNEFNLNLNIINPFSNIYYYLIIVIFILLNSITQYIVSKVKLSKSLSLIIKELYEKNK